LWCEASWYPAQGRDDGWIWGTSWSSFCHLI
jgi:hypothetical protein